MAPIIRWALAQGVSDHCPINLEHEATVRNIFQANTRAIYRMIARGTTQSNARITARTNVRTIA